MHSSVGNRVKVRTLEQARARLWSENTPTKDITACYLYPAENFYPILKIILTIFHKI